MYELLKQFSIRTNDETVLSLYLIADLLVWNVKQQTLSNWGQPHLVSTVGRSDPVKREEWQVSELNTDNKSLIKNEKKMVPRIKSLQ